MSIRSTFADVFTRIDRINHNLEKISLINNAGVAVFTPSEERTDEEIKSVTQINLNSVIYGTTEFARYIKKQIEKMEV